MSKIPAGVNLNEEQLVALIVLNDARALRLSYKAGEAFFRGFIVRNRQSSVMEMRFRFRYQDGDSWFEVRQREGQPRAEAIREFREGITHVLLGAAAGLGVALEPSDVMFFEPPDDEGNWERTVQWLVEGDLVHPRKSGGDI